MLSQHMAKCGIAWCESPAFIMRRHSCCPSLSDMSDQSTKPHGAVFLLHTVTCWTIILLQICILPSRSHLGISPRRWWFKTYRRSRTRKSLACCLFNVTAVSAILLLEFALCGDFGLLNQWVVTQKYLDLLTLAESKVCNGLWLRDVCVSRAVLSCGSRPLWEVRCISDM